ncbi:hypothetical protein BJP40_08310 [Streptomyces sp. CC53]|uniref:hypothetical protein n=1 Tax=Streptomyces sp. CC53 TaxID=1906740 RepID=UPI0008DD9BA8|nr:hypothetical protein [Streptomyces sp. CC53]OII60856.1 hypothetical protein BJP40_08310 [Streptomyces sp. CC53]
MPHVPQDLLDRINALEREVKQLRGRAQIRPALNQVLSGDVVIGEGGQLFAKTPGGVKTFIVGQTPEGDWGVGLGREQGTAALTVGDDVLSTAQMIRMWSRSGEVIAMDDAYADDFLGRPSIPIPMQPTSAMQTSSTTLSTAWVGASRLMNPVLWCAIETYTPAGVTANVQVEDDDGVIEQWTAAASNGWTYREITKPVRSSFFQHRNYRVKHNVISGSGTIRTNFLGMYTRNTFTAEEAPQ